MSSNDVGSSLKLVKVGEKPARRNNYMQTEPDTQGLLKLQFEKRKQELMKIPFGDLDPELAPVFGFPIMNFTPYDRTQSKEDQTQEMWRRLTSQITSTQKCGDKHHQQVGLLNSMIAKRKESHHKRKLVFKALTYGYKLHNHEVPHHY